MKVFISHAFEDNASFDNLCYALEQKAVPFWKPKDMRGGLSLRDQLRKAIDQCDVCIFLATQNSVKAHWCHAELGAFWGSGKRVIMYVADESLSHEDLPQQSKEDIWHRQVRDVVRDAKEALEEAQEARRAALAQGGILLQGREQPPILNEPLAEDFRDLFIAGPTLAIAATKQDYFFQIVRSGGQVKLLIPDPDQHSPAMLGLRSHWHFGIDGFAGFLGEVRSALNKLSETKAKIKRGRWS